MSFYHDIQAEIAAGNVTESRDGNLVIYKYSETCAHENRWNEVNVRCRGLVFDLSDPDKPRQLTHPFRKFFNLGERVETCHENLPNEPFEVFEKLDGSCGVGFIDPDTGKWRLATPGILTSEQAIRGTAMLAEYDTSWLLPDDTAIFEIIYPENRIVVDYADRAELVLLAVFDRNGDEVPQGSIDRIIKFYGASSRFRTFSRPKRYDHTALGNMPFEENAEGYVVRFKSGLRVKIKSPLYVRIHRLLEYVSPKRVLALVRGLDQYGETADGVAAALPGHLRGEFDDIRALLTQRHHSITTTAKFKHFLLSHETFTTRKEKALWIKANVPRGIDSLVFSLLDDRDINDQAWKLVERELDIRAVGDPIGNGRPVNNEAITAMVADIADSVVPKVSRHGN
jgi:RNA ligase